MTPEGGLGLMFQTLPVVFSNMVGGHILAISFFLLVALAALTSEISVLEPIIAYFVDKHDWTRKNAALTEGAMAFVIGILCALSTSLLSDWTLWGKDILELFDLVATTILVPQREFSTKSCPNILKYNICYKQCAVGSVKKLSYINYYYHFSDNSNFLYKRCPYNFVCNLIGYLSP